MTQIHICNKCKTAFPTERYDIGYRTCIECSEEPKWSAVPVINHKTGNEIQIVKDPEDAAEFLHKSARVGFGTMRGMSSSYKRKTNKAASSTVLLAEAPPTDRELGRSTLPNKYLEVGEEVMSLIDEDNWEGARNKIKTALAEKRIWGIHSKQLNEILNALELNKTY
jgi:hypothetical protein